MTGSKNLLALRRVANRRHRCVCACVCVRACVCVCVCVCATAFIAFHLVEPWKPLNLMPIACLEAYSRHALGLMPIAGLMPLGSCYGVLIVAAKHL